MVLHNAELRDLYGLSSIIGAMRYRRVLLAGLVATNGENINRGRILVGKSLEKSTLGRPRRKGRLTLGRWILRIGDG
jgi:hypothetical protein